MWTKNCIIKTNHDDCRCKPGIGTKSLLLKETTKPLSQWPSHRKWQLPNLAANSTKTITSHQLFTFPFAGIKPYHYIPTCKRSSSGAFLQVLRRCLVGFAPLKMIVIRSKKGRGIHCSTTRASSMFCPHCTINYSYIYINIKLVLWVIIIFLFPTLCEWKNKNCTLTKRMNDATWAFSIIYLTTSRGASIRATKNTQVAMFLGYIG